MAKSPDKVREFDAANRAHWRRWLKANHATASNIWLVMYHKNSGKQTLTYNDAVEEALCFGWVDSLVRSRDHESSMQMFGPRKPKSNWSKSNKERVDRLMAAGLMMPAGLAMVELAKATGTWDVLSEAQSALIPNDLQKALRQNPEAQKYFNAFPAFSKRFILEWIATAKKTETRKKRIEETVTLAAKNIRANHRAEKLKLRKGMI